MVAVGSTRGGDQFHQVVILVGIPQPPDSSALAIALEVLSRSLVAADDLTLDQVRPLLIRLVDEPYRAQEISPRLISLLIAR